jgi:hypothetical protein
MEEEAVEGLQSYEELQANLQEYTAQLQQVRAIALFVLWGRCCCWLRLALRLRLLTHSYYCIMPERPHSLLKPTAVA